jgi:hypothetical protein
MYSLDSVFFLTPMESDVGFPAFQNSRDNRLFTCTLNKDLEIQSFLPVYLEKFHHSQLPNFEKSFSLGDKFPFLFFRVNSQPIIIDLASGPTHIENTVEQYRQFPFIRLQVARYYSMDNKSRAIKAISDAANSFDLDEDSRLGFISSESSLVSLNRGIWDAAGPRTAKASSSDDYFREFAGIDKARATGLLRDASLKTSEYWPYLFVTYASKFGFDEFLFILAKEHLTKLALYERMPTQIVGRITRLTFDYQMSLNREGQSSDREFCEVMEELINTEVFAVLVRFDPSLAAIAFKLLHSNQAELDFVNDLLEFLLDNEDWLPEISRRELTELIKSHVRRLEHIDLTSFSDAFAIEEKDFDRLSELAPDKTRLLISVQARLNRLLRYRAEEDVDLSASTNTES